MWMTEGSLSREQVRQMFGMDAVVTATNTSLALLLAVILVEEPRAAPILLIPIGIAFARLSLLRERAPAPREARVPLRGKPRPVAVARGRAGARRAAEVCARGVSLRAGGGDPVQLREQLAVADKPRSRREEREHDCGRSTRRRRAERAARRTAGTDHRRGGTLFGDARALPRVARRAARHACRAAGRGADRRPDHARQPLGFLAPVHRRRPGAVRHARRERERCAPV